MTSPTCSQSSTSAAEPIAGTAVHDTFRWLGLEYRGRWEARALDGALLPPAVRQVLTRFQAHPGARIQLLKGRRRAGPLTCFFADTTPGAQRVHRIPLQHYEDLLDLDLDALVAGTEAFRTDEPLLWVCTNGRRDACCARHGSAVYGALDARAEHVWQTDHLGGHRFAATLLSLPDGLCYGRLRVSDAQPLLDAIRQGRIYDLRTLRGRTAWSRAAQAAECHVRATTGDLRQGAITLATQSDGHVTLVLADTVHEVALDAVPLPNPVVPSCGKPPGPAFAFVPRSAPT